MGLISRVSSRTYRQKKTNMTSTIEKPQNIGDLPKVPEFSLKQRKRNKEVRQRAQKKTDRQIAKNIRGRRQPKPINFKRLEWFVERANKREWERLRVLREARAPKAVQDGNLDRLPPAKTECPAILIVRTCRKQYLTKAAKKLLNQLKLTRVYQAVLAHLDQSMINRLTILKECVVWGHVAPLTVRELIMKRGKMGVPASPVPLTDNIKIEERLGKFNVICLEDLVFELTQPEAKQFQTCNAMLLPFQLSLPEGGKRAVTNFSEKAVQPGFRKEAELHDLIEKMV